MANTIDDLYLKYTGKVGKTLENDRYFQYLYEMVQNSQNIFQHTNQVLHKVVDERWLSTIEESLDAINTIIEKPRRFVTTKEEVVPVALAKKITADSVRHLSMNTQFIASGSDGNIMPTRILNVSTEESFDLYENRFIYHLIQRLVTFIDKRTDVIFWSTGDETCNYMSMSSQVDDAYEQIEYKLEMKVKNRKSIVENNSDNMSVYMRIDQVRRLVMALRNSSFCQLMAGCAKVHSPIQRTNLMMKDPHYRTCYKLWQFLESYDEVGYSIDTIETPLEFDEEYMIQMYTNLITNYTVFKSLLESDSRKLAEVGPVKKKHIKPKFIKQVHEEVVDDPNIPEVEIKKVFIEEVTEAQVAAEAEVARLTEELRTEKSARISAETAAEESMMQVGQLMQQSIELQGSLAAETEARETAEAECAQITQEAEEALAEAEQNLAQAKEETQATIAQITADAESRRQEELAQAEQRRQIELAEAENRRQTELAEAESRRQTELTEAENRRQTELAEAENRRISELSVIESKMQTELAAAEERRQSELEKAEEKRQSDLAAIKSRKEKELSEAENRRQTELAEAENRRQAETTAAESRRVGELAAAESRRVNELEALRSSLMAEFARKQKELEDSLNAKHQAEMIQLEQTMQADALKREKKLSEDFNTRYTAMKAARDSVQAKLVKETEIAEAESRRAESEKQRADQTAAKLSEAENRLKNKRRIWRKNS